MNFIKFTEANPDAYIVRVTYNEQTHQRMIRIHGISGDVETWTGDTYKTEAEAYLRAYIWLRKQQLEEMSTLECVMGYKGIEGYPSNRTIFEKHYPDLHNELYQRKAQEIQRGLKEKK